MVNKFDVQDTFGIFDVLYVFDVFNASVMNGQFQLSTKGIRFWCRFFRIVSRFSEKERERMREGTVRKIESGRESDREREIGREVRELNWSQQC